MNFAMKLCIGGMLLGLGLGGFFGAVLSVASAIVFGEQELKVLQIKP